MHYFHLISQITYSSKNICNHDIARQKLSGIVRSRLFQKIKITLLIPTMLFFYIQYETTLKGRENQLR